MTPLPTLRQLQFFVALARRKSFSRAAEDCLVSQSTLSAGIKELEYILNVVLVDRTSRGFALTPIGEDMVGPAGQLLAQAEDLARSAHRTAPLTGVMKLGIIPTIAPYILPKSMPILEKKFPDLSLYLRENLSDQLVNSVRAGIIDIALMAFPYETEDLETLTFAEDEFWFACAQGHKLHTRKKITHDDLLTEELLLLEDGHCLRDHALSACKLQEQKMANAFGATSLFTLAQMTRTGLGATLLPEMAIKQGLAKASSIVAIPFKATKANPAPMRQIGLAWRKGSGLQEDAAALAAVFKKILSS